MHKVIFIPFLLLLITLSLNAQQWTPEQLEVWKTVQTYTDLANKGDVEGFLF